MTNIEFLNTLAITDSSMTQLFDPGPEKLMSYPNLQKDFYRIRKANPFLGNLQVARVVILQHETNPTIEKNLKLMEYISLCLGWREGYMQWINRELYTNRYEISSDGSVERNGLSIEVRVNTLEFYLGRSIFMKRDRNYMYVFGEGKRLLGTFTAGQGIEIENGIAGFIVCSNGKHITYEMKLGNQGMYISNIYPTGEVSSHRMGDDGYHGIVECILNLWDLREIIWRT